MILLCGTLQSEVESKFETRRLKTEKFFLCIFHAFFKCLRNLRTSKKTVKQSSVHLWPLGAARAPVTCSAARASVGGLGRLTEITGLCRGGANHCIRARLVCDVITVRLFTILPESVAVQASVSSETRAFLFFKSNFIKNVLLKIKY